MRSLKTKETFIISNIGPEWDLQVLGVRLYIHDQDCNPISWRSRWCTGLVRKIVINISCSWSGDHKLRDRSVVMCFDILALFVFVCIYKCKYICFVGAGSMSTNWGIAMIWPMRCVDIRTLLWGLHLIDWKLCVTLVTWWHWVLGKPCEVYPVTVSWVVSLPAPYFESGQQSVSIWLNPTSC